MNEQIRELAEQAYFDCDITTSIKIPKEFVEKFAELIVKECAKVADLADENKCEWIGGNILTHFGLEE
jgi:MoaA/NifB/PqqE/SkfB family radical SAM enzyme